MAFKPSDFFVGVIDFFAVLLPGAIIVAIGYPHIPAFVLGEQGILARPVGEGAQWMAFAVGAYLAGHFLFLIGAALDSTLYDRLRSLAVPVDGDRTFLAAEGTRDRMLAGLDAGINPFQWSRAVLRLRAPAALMEVERFEADSKFFRSLCVALYALTLVFLRAPGSQASCRATGGSLCGGWSAFAAAVAIPLLFAVAEGVRRYRGAKRRGRARALWTLAALLALGLVASSVLARNWQALILFVLALLCLLRYAERRWKSTRTAYQYMVVVDRTTRPPRGRASVAQAGAIAVRRGAVPRLLLVRARSGERAWIFPKGHIEPGEGAVAAAVRELREEAGVAGRPLARAGASFFVSNGEDVTVQYYLMEALPGSAAHEARERRWCTAGEALELLAFPDARRLVRRVSRLLDAGLLRTPGA